MPSQILAKVFNLILLMSKLPASMSGSRTIFIPKVKGSVSPLDYRPISITSHFTRLFHKILAQRLYTSTTFAEAQRGFRSTDGCSDNIHMLSALIKNARSKLKGLHIAILDIQKAFDSVKHSAILLAARKKGLPEPFLRYLEFLYGDSQTCLQVGKAKSAPFRPSKGVRQGDPLSPILFNFVMDFVISSLPDHIGYKIGSSSVNCLAFADDLVLVASTAQGLQDLLNIAEKQLSYLGLKFNSEKSKCLSLVPSGYEKKMFVASDTSLNIGGETLQVIDVESLFKYLGVLFDVKGRSRAGRVGGMMEKYILELTKAPLKPQQRLFIFINFVVPKFYYHLVLGNTSVSELNRCDKQSRAAIRKWLRLPSDVPNAFIHSSVKDGGLGVPAYRWRIPRLKVERLLSFEKHECAMFQDLMKLDEMQEDLGRAKRWATLSDGRTLMTVEQEHKFWRGELLKSVDGSGLREAKDFPGVHQWISDGTSLLTGRDYIDAVKLRINALATKARVARGRPEKEKQCRFDCRVPETLPHILQRCHKAHGLRVKRHDRVCKLVAGYLLQKGYSTEREFLYVLPTGNLKPDIVAWIDGRVTVLEVHVVGDSKPMNGLRAAKLKYYMDKLSLKNAILQKTKCKDISFATLTVSYRGVWQQDSAKELQYLGITAGQFKILTVNVLQGSLSTYRTFSMTT